MFMTSIARDRPNQYICCFCIHVRTATIAIGILNLAILCGALMSHPQGFLQNGADTTTNDTRIANTQTHVNSDKFSGLLFIISMFTINLMLLIGAVQYRQAYLMPFFCVQVLEFSISFISGISFLFYTPDIKEWIINESRMPELSKQEIMTMKSETLKLITIISIIFGLIFKAYLIDIVARCYKYFIYKSEQLNNLVDILENSEIAAATAVVNQHQIDTSNMLLPPKYEDVFSVVITEDETMPPSYSSDNAPVNHSA